MGVDAAMKSRRTCGKARGSPDPSVGAKNPEINWATPTGASLQSTRALGLSRS